MSKEKVVIDVWNTEDGYQIYRVYRAYKPIGVFEPPNNTYDGGFFRYDIDEKYFKDWDVVEDYRVE
tara:strand:- start:116 stop:313 length:198 start_codon:yes stop_codon:yes gene_type:complete